MEDKCCGNCNHSMYKTRKNDFDMIYCDNESSENYNYGISYGNSCENWKEIDKE